MTAIIDLPFQLEPDSPIWDQLVLELFDLQPGAVPGAVLAVIEEGLPIPERVTLAALLSTVVGSSSDHESDQHSDQDQGHPNAAEDECANSA